MTVHRRGRGADKRKLHHRDKRPCRSAPSTPTGVTLTFGRRWADHQIHFRGIVRWTAVTTDVASRLLTPETYEVQLRATDASGVPTETDAGDAAIWRAETKVGDDATTRAVFTQLHRPKTWYYQARVRAMNRVNGKRCYSAWSAWTTAAQPVTGALTGPPAPTGVSLSMARTEPSKTRPFTATVTANEVPNWTPTDGDVVTGATHYLVQLAVSNDGGSSTTNTREAVVAADVSLSTFTAQFVGLKRGRSYRARAKSFWGETEGAFSSWTAWRAATTDLGTGPNAAINIVTTKPRPRLLVTTWDPPTVGEDVDEYRVRVYRGTTLKETTYTRTRKHRYEVPDIDAGKGHRVKVTVIDEVGNLSTEADPGSDITEGGVISGQIIQPGTLSGPVNFGDGQITPDGTMLLPSQPGSGFMVPAANLVASADGDSGNGSIFWPAATKQGSLLLCWVVAFGTSTPTISTPAGWTSVGTSTSGSGVRGTLFKIENAAIQADNSSVSTTISTNSGWSMTLLEYVGTDVQDVTATNTGSGGTLSTGTTATTAQAEEAWLAFFGWDDANPHPVNPTNGFLEIASPTLAWVTAKNVTATGTASSGGTITAVSNYIARVITFKAKAQVATIEDPPSGGVGVFAVTALGASRLAFKGDDSVDRIIGANIGFVAYRNATNSHTSTGNFQAVGFNSVVYNDGTMFNVSTDRFTVPAGFDGRWAIEARVGFAANSSGIRQLKIVKNPAGTPVDLDFTNHTNPAAGNPAYMFCQRTVDLVAGDVIEIQAHQSSGGNLVYAGTDASQRRFAATYIGPGG